jgi:hypothetical protein
MRSNAADLPGVLHACSSFSAIDDVLSRCQSSTAASTATMTPMITSVQMGSRIWTGLAPRAK